MLLGDESCARLENSHVAVFGLGGVGSWCAEALARAGVGRLTLIDQDEVGESNINRQLVALHSTLGRPKAQVLEKRLLDINPQLKVKALVARYEADSREEFFAEKYDFVVDCIDLVACKLDLIITAKEREIPVVSALGTGNKCEAQKLALSDISKTRNCPLARVVRKELRKRGIKNLDVVYSEELAMKPEDAEEPPPGRRSVPGSLVWVPASAGMLLCQHVVMSITGNAGK